MLFATLIFITLLASLLALPQRAWMRAAQKHRSRSIASEPVRDRAAAIYVRKAFRLVLSLPCLMKRIRPTQSDASEDAPCRIPPAELMKRLLAAIPSERR